MYLWGFIYFATRYPLLCPAQCLTISHTAILFHDIFLITGKDEPKAFRLWGRICCLSPTALQGWSTEVSMNYYWPTHTDVCIWSHVVYRRKRPWSWPLHQRKALLLAQGGNFVIWAHFSHIVFCSALEGPQALKRGFQEAWGTVPWERSQESFVPMSCRGWSSATTPCNCLIMWIWSL